MKRLDTIRDTMVGKCAAHPWFVLTLVVLITFAFGSQLRRLQMDTDPKSMLPASAPVRTYNDQVENWFGIHPDVIVVGISSESGIFEPSTLARVASVTDQIARLPGVIARDLAGLGTVIDVTTSDSGMLQAHPILEQIPSDAESAKKLERQVLGNSLLVNRVISKDAKTTAIYVPIEKTASGKVVADQIKAVATHELGPERYFISGDPVARHTMGEEMFRQRRVFAPLAALIMSALLWYMFRSWRAIFNNLAVALIAIVWSMGLFGRLGIPIHILASMAPIFLIAISTDTVHILNEFTFRRTEVPDRRQAILQTMKAVGAPILFSDLTTIAGFASLAIGPIVPARVFGLMVAFGTCVIVLLSFTLVPALLALGGDRQLSPVKLPPMRPSPTLAWLGQFSVAWKGRIALAGVILIVVSIVGISRVRVNNNLLAYFKSNSEIRIADRHLSKALGGTAPMYLVAEGNESSGATRPEFLLALSKLQRSLDQDPIVGKTVSVVDVLERVNRVLNGNTSAEERLPDSQDAVGQYLLLFSTAEHPKDLDNVIDMPYEKTNLMVQLRSWDTVETRALLDRIQAHLAAHPLPGMQLRPAGMGYFNLVWSDQVLVGMLEGFIASCILVLFLLILDYRSLRWGVLSFLPLLFTVILIYGAIGFVGKDFDLPVAVLSTLSLGLAVDFAIHFVSRFQQRYRESGDLNEALLWTVMRPGRGIMQNAVLFAAGFSVMLFAALTPYITVGACMIAIMLVSALATLVFIPSLIAFYPRVFSLASFSRGSVKA